MNEKRPDHPIHTLNATDLKNMLGAALAVLQRHKTEVDEMNVFPAPDGDTGANMTQTLQSAWKAIEGEDVEHAGALLRDFAHGAIRGARGNSGVILSQMLHGMASAIGDRPELDAAALARAFRQGQQIAYQGVMQPVEGTILTIISALADAWERAAARSDDIGSLLENSLQKARDVLAQTPNMLPVLKQAGVVDAGGAGLVYIIEGMTSFLRGEPIAAEIASDDAPGRHPHLKALGDEWGYDIQYLIYNAGQDEESIKQKLIALGGESIVVARAGVITKVHVHGDNPGPFLDYGASLGHLDDIVVENMTLQTLRRRGQWDEARGVQKDAGEEAVPHPANEHCASVVAVAAGVGFAQVFRELGVCQVVMGGQTMNPSTEELLQALNQVDADEVVILPNNKNIIMAARQAAELSHKTAYVAATRTLPQGVAAMFAFNAAASAAENARMMQAMAEDVHTIEVTTAVRDASIDGVAVRQGQVMALMDGRLCCSGESPAAAALQAIAALDAADADVITLYYGQPTTTAEAQALSQQLSELYPQHQIEAIWGGQPHYHYIISVE